MHVCPALDLISYLPAAAGQGQALVLLTPPHLQEEGDTVLGGLHDGQGDRALGETQPGSARSVFYKKPVGDSPGG